jgi:ATP-dependent helicase HrpB
MQQNDSHIASGCVDTAKGLIEPDKKKMNGIETLPVMDCTEALLEALRRQQAVVLKAPPGAGKTTAVPPAILDSGIVSPQQILVVQPRRLAATATAARIAELRGSTIGKEVGYHVRFDNKSSGETKLLTLTTGVLLRRLIADPLLESAGCVVLDEFHERSIEMDLALGMIEQIRKNFRPELRLVVMSATMDMAPIKDFLKDAISLESDGRSYPVDIQYDREMRQEAIETQIAQSLHPILRETNGNVLVFLPGVGEILRVKRHLQSLKARMTEWTDIELIELHGSLSPQKQSLALRPTRHRKVILSTNVAETSVTIPGIEAVIDSGTARILNHDMGTGLPKLQIEPISQASTDQRAGRAGRTGPGKCHRLWPLALQRSRREADLPEILRGDLSGVVLTLAKFGERDFDGFPWLTKPPLHAVEHATAILRRLGAIDHTGVITPLGEKMVQLPLSPRLARLMLDANTRGITYEASLAAALLSERDPFQTGQLSSNHEQTTSPGLQKSNPKQPIEHSLKHSVHDRGNQCDLWSRVQTLITLDQDRQQQTSTSPSVKQILRVAKQLRRSVKNFDSDDMNGKRLNDQTRESNQGETESKNHLRTDNRNTNKKPSVENLHPSIRLAQSLFSAFPDRLAKKRSSATPSRATRSHSSNSKDRQSLPRGRGVLGSGRGVILGQQSNVKDRDFFLCLDMESSGVEAKVRLACGIKTEWLDSENSVEKNAYLYDKEKKSVVARRQRFIGELLIHESPITCSSGTEAAKILFNETKHQLQDVLPQNNPQIPKLVARVSLVRDYFPDLNLVEIDDKLLCDILFNLCHHHTSIAALQKADWYSQITNQYDYDTMREIDRLAPSALRIPNGRSVGINYEKNKPPMIAVRIQEIFGWKETPRIAEGRVTIQLHLLGPNGRPQQITDDLENFWSNTYQHIKKELKRRYPKHAWPDDPLAATATHNGLKR